MQPPNGKAAYVAGGLAMVLLVGWYAVARRAFPGPPGGVLSLAARMMSLGASGVAVKEEYTAGDVRY